MADGLRLVEGSASMEEPARPDYRAIAVKDLKDGRAPGESIAHWQRRVDACLRVIERCPDGSR